MAVTGTLRADFSEFFTATQKAETSIKSMEGGAAKASVQLREMSTGAVGPTNTLRESFGQVDQALAAAGINVGKYGRGLVEIADLSGKTAKEIGFLASGAAIFSALMAGYQFGTWIAGFTGLDKAVQRYADSLTTVGAETAAAKQDTINLALHRGSGEVLSYADAVKFLTQQAELQNATYAVSSERLAAAQKEVRGLSDETIAAIEIAKKNHATTEQITKVYGISADGLRALAERQKLAGDAAEAHTKALNKQRAEADELDKTYAKLMSDVSNANQLAIMEADHAAMVAAEMKKKNDAAAGWIAANVKATAATREAAAADEAYMKEQDALTAATDALSQAHTDGGQAASQATGVAIQGYQGVAQQVQITGEAIKEWIRLMQYSAQVNAILNQNHLFTTQSQFDQIAALGRGAAGGGVGAGVTVNIASVMGDPEEIGRRVKAAIVDADRSTGRRLAEA